MWQVLKVQLISEEEAFFLFNMDLSEEDFRALKADQSLVVDFVHFPDKIATLIDRCSPTAIAGQSKCAFPRFSPSVDWVQSFVVSKRKSDLLSKQIRHL